MNNFLFIFFLLVLALQTAGQTDQKPENLFSDAEYYRMYEEHVEALPLYQRVLNNGFDNAHINYRIGECYLNIPGQKERAIPYLQKAVTNIDENFREGSFNEKKAPIYALFYLGKAYQIKNQLDTALVAYNRFLNALKNENNYNMDFVEKQIHSCRTAKKFMENPIHIYRENVGNTVNDAFSNVKPIVDSSESRILYTSKLQFYDAIFMAEKVNGEWKNPINLTPQIKSDGNFYSSALDADGDQLILFKSDPYHGNLYMSEFDRVKEEWKEPQKLGKNINSRFWETHGCMSEDNKTLYFTSNRKGGFGGLDIYVSHFNEEKNEWMEPQNVGDKINTPYNEETPFITCDGKRLYFSSQGHQGMGGFDVFYTEKTDDDKWTEPLNIGYPISKTDDDLFFHPVQNGNAGYMAKYSDEGYGAQDIYRIEVYSKDNPKLIDLKGRIMLSQNLKGISNQDFTVSIDSVHGPKLQILSPRGDSMYYSYTLTPGSYQVTFTGNGYESVSKSLSLSWDYHEKSYDLNAKLNPKELIAKNDIIRLPGIFFGFDKSSLDERARKKLDSASMVLKNNPDVQIEVYGHTDAIGDMEYNRKLSERRARSVIEYLNDKGIESKRMIKKAKGENYPVALNKYQSGKDCPKGRKYNRRVEIKPFSSETKNIVDNLGNIPNELRIKDGVYYTVLLFQKSEKLPEDYFESFPSLKGYSINVLQNGKYIYTLGKYANQEDAINPYHRAINLNFKKARIISSYQLEEMLKPE